MKHWARMLAALLALLFIPAAALSEMPDEAVPEEIEAQLVENGVSVNEGAPEAHLYELTVDPAAKVQTFTMDVGDTLRLRVSSGAASGWTPAKKGIVTVTDMGEYADIQADGEAGKLKLTSAITGGSKKKASLNLVINNPYIPTAVAFSAAMPAWVPAGTRLYLPDLVTVTPEYAVTTLTFKATGAGKVKGGWLTAAKAGKAKITVTASNNRKARAVYTLEVPANKVDKMNGKPAAGDIAALSGGWTLWPVSLAVNKKGGLDCQFQLLNGTGDKVTAIENLSLSVAAGNRNRVVASASGRTVKAAVAKGKAKLIKLTLDAAPLLSETFLPEYSGAGKLYFNINAGAVRLAGKGGSYDFIYTSRFPAPKPVERVQLSQATAALQPGEALALTAEALPSDADCTDIAWASSDPAVASVDNGTVTAVAPGAATITASALDGSGATAACAVTVAEPQPEPGPEPVVEASISLSASRNSLTTADSVRVYFYAALDRPLPGGASVRLCHADGTFITDMYDDGQYSSDGDELPNDSVYTAPVDFDCPAEGSYGYCAAVGGVKSNEVTITVGQQLDTAVFHAVDDAVYAAMDREGYGEMGVEEKAAAVKGALDALAAQGEVIGDSVEYDSGASVVSFEYANGVLGGVLLEPFSDTLNSPAAPARTELPRTGADVGIVPADGAAANASGSLARACVLNGFEENQNRQGLYTGEDGLVTFWNEKGIATTFKAHATVKDFKAISPSKYNIYVFSMHGSSVSGLPVMVLNEEVDDWKDQNDYVGDLMFHRIARFNIGNGQYRYAILPRFFKDHFEPGDLDNCMFLSESCSFWGNDVIGFKSNFADRLTANGAAFVAGCYRPVNCFYTHAIVKYFGLRLLLGDTAKAAMDLVAGNYGHTDALFESSTSQARLAPAELNYVGGEAVTLVGSGLVNGSFEQATTPKGWITTGDVRVIAKIGDLTPPDGARMALLTTGIGSQESEYLSGNEGSTLTQSLYIPAGATKLSFTYDVISEEPLEFVNSDYDDRFEVDLLDDRGASLLELTREAVNTSSWIGIDGIDFDGGDQTTFHTGWRTVEADVSAFAGRQVILSAAVYDVGDSAYDTAAILDAVTLK